MTWRRSGGRARKRPQLLERSGGVAAGLGAIHHHVLATWIRRVEPAAVQVKLADERMTIMVDS